MRLLFTPLMPILALGWILGVHAISSALSSQMLEGFLKPDIGTTDFSLQTGYFLSQMSVLAYEKEAEVRKILTEDLGYTHFFWIEVESEVSEELLFDAIEDTEGFVAANDDVVLVVFRGSLELSDWATDAKVILTPTPTSWGVRGRIHQGFNQAITTVWKKRGLLDIIRNLLNEPGKNRKLLLAGHSLGGALATVSAARLAFEEDTNIHGLYTIGCPRVFDDELGRIFDEKMNYGKTLVSKCFRVRNNNDAVTRLPFLPYRHVGTEIYFDRYGVISTTSLADRILGRLEALLEGTFSDGIDDHSSESYTKLLESALIESKKSMGEKTVGVLSQVVGP